jgi:hypothetical protein
MSGRPGVVHPTGRMHHARSHEDTAELIRSAVGRRDNNEGPA